MLFSTPSGRGGMGVPSLAFQCVSGRGLAMSQEMIAALIAVGAVALTLIGVLRLMRPRQMTLPDYPELPPPPKDDGADTPPRGA
jgi:hypothetical protein